MMLASHTVANAAKHLKTASLRLTPRFLAIFERRVMSQVTGLLVLPSSSSSLPSSANSDALILKHREEITLEKAEASSCRAQIAEL